MRKLYLLRGTPGIGKSTFIKLQHLEEYTISLDKLRLLYASPKAKWHADSQEVRYEISQAVNKQVFEQLYKLVAYRMQGGESLVVDGTHTYAGAYSQYKKLAKQYAYEIVVIDFNKELLAKGNSDEDNLELLYRQNRQRAELRQVTDDVIKQSYYWAKSNPVPKGLTVITPATFKQARLMEGDDLNLQGYTKALIIGDIHSSSTVLNKLLDTYDPRDNPDMKFIFVGDYFDRGMEAVDTMDTLQSIWDLPNVVLLRGNHEKHIDNYLSGDNIRSEEFRERTLPELTRAFDDRDFYQLQQHLKSLYLFKLGTLNVMVTHGGLTSEQVFRYLMPDANHPYSYEVGLQDESYFVNGIGGFGLDVDAEFEDYLQGAGNTIEEEIYDDQRSIDTPSSVPTNQDYNYVKDHFIQVHGHRNEYHHGVLDFQHSYNLEQQVEAGGKLGAVMLTVNADGTGTVSDESLSNPVYADDTAERHDSYAK